MTTQYYAQNKDGLYLCERNHKMYLCDTKDDLYVCANERRIVGHLKAMRLNLDDFLIKEYGDEEVKDNVNESYYYDNTPEIKQKAEKIINGGDNPACRKTKDNRNFAIYYVDDDPKTGHPVYVITEEIGGIETIVAYETNDQNKELDELLDDVIGYKYIGTEGGGIDPVGFGKECMEYAANNIITRKVQPERKIKYHGNYYLIYNNPDCDCQIIMQVQGNELRYVNWYCGGVNDNQAIREYIDQDKDRVKTDAGLNVPNVRNVDGNGIEDVKNPKINRENPKANSNKQVSIKEFMKHFASIVANTDDSELEKLYEQDYVLSLDGLEVHIPYCADAYYAVYDFLRDVVVDREILDGLERKETGKEMTESVKEKKAPRLVESNEETYKGQLDDGTPVTIKTSFKRTARGNTETVFLTVGDKQTRGTDTWHNRPWYKYEYENALRDAVRMQGYDQDVIDITSTARNIRDAVGILAKYISNL